MWAIFFKIWFLWFPWCSQSGILKSLGYLFNIICIDKDHQIKSKGRKEDVYLSGSPFSKLSNFVFYLWNSDFFFLFMCPDNSKYFLSTIIFSTWINPRKKKKKKEYYRKRHWALISCWFFFFFFHNLIF